MIEQAIVYARLAPGSRHSWLRLLAAGWVFAEPTAPAPMAGHHGSHAVLMVSPGSAAPAGGGWGAPTPRAAGR